MGPWESFQCQYVFIGGNEVGKSRKMWANAGSLGKDGKRCCCRFWTDSVLLYDISFSFGTIPWHHIRKKMLYLISLSFVFVPQWKTLQSNNHALNDHTVCHSDVYSFNYHKPSTVKGVTPRYNQLSSVVTNVTGQEQTKCEIRSRIKLTIQNTATQGHVSKVY